MFKKKTIISALALALTANAGAQVTPVSQMEKLDRGVIALPSESSGYLVSWRFLGTDDETHTTFDVLRNGKVVGKADAITDVADDTFACGAKADATTAIYSPSGMKVPAIDNKTHGLYIIRQGSKVRQILK